VGALGLGRIDTRPELGINVNARLAAWVVLVSVLAIAFYADRFSEGKPPEDILYRWDTFAGATVQFAIILGLVLLIARGAPELLALRRPRSWSGALWRALVVLVGVYVLSAILGPILHPGREQGLTPDTWESSHAAAFFANAFVVCVVAPFVEETTFRGVGFGLLRARFGVDPAIVGSAVFFGLAHGLVEALPLLVAFGIGLAWLRQTQESTIPGMILHGTFNAIALAASLAT
jgi:membrane protease YdiL (CAAX protease family)